MDEESLHYWIIPILCMVAIIPIFAFSLDYKINTIFPNAAIEIQEIKEMDCAEILIKDSSNDYWTSENAKVGNAKAISCAAPQESKGSNKSPYVEFCMPGGFAPVKTIGNSTHSFNHDTCIWDLK